MPEKIRLGYFSEDTQDLLRILEAHGVRYLIVGGEAVIFHGHARLTGDVDIFYEPKAENADKLYAALTDFWQGIPPGIESNEELTRIGTIFQFGIPPNRIDLINSIDGVEFEECWSDRTIVEADSPFGVVRIFYISIPHLIKNKEASARPKDLDDVNFLKRIIV
jgi:hypothetical protein